MTNSAKKKPEILEVWSSLKEKLSKLIFLNKNKELIKEAVKVYLDYSSTFISLENNNDLISYWTKWRDEFIQKFNRSDQREKGEKIIKECKELLKELE